MKQFLLLSLSVGVAFLHCKSQNQHAANMISAQQKNEGWQLLFNGKTMNGWHSYGKTTAGSNWKVQDGILLRDTLRGTDGKETQGSDLVTNEEFKNFHLKLEWKITKNGNSGIVFLVKEDPVKYPDTYNTGYEMQIYDMQSATHTKNRKHDTGDLYDLVAATNAISKPTGQWNFAEIVVNNGALNLFLNGNNIVSTTLWDDNFRALIANSKFAAMENFGTFKKGRIALQDHGGGVYFRNVMIKRL